MQHKENEQEVQKTIGVIRAGNKEGQMVSKPDYALFLPVHIVTGLMTKSIMPICLLQVLRYPGSNTSVVGEQKYVNRGDLARWPPTPLHLPSLSAKACDSDSIASAVSAVNSSNKIESYIVETKSKVLEIA